MIAVLEFVNGFSHNTKVLDVFPTLEIAKRYYKHNFQYQEFNFGEITLDIHKTLWAYPEKNRRN